MAIESTDTVVEDQPWRGKRYLARLMATYASAKLQEMDIVGRWLGGTPEPLLRTALGRQVWDLSRLFKLFEERMKELQGKLESNFMTEHFREALAVAGGASTSVERIAGLHGVVFKYELKLYRAHAELAEPVTEWYLKQVIREQEDLVRWGEAALAGLVNSQEKWNRAHRVQDELRAYLERDSAERPLPAPNYTFDVLEVPNVTLFQFGGGRQLQGDEPLT